MKKSRLALAALALALCAGARAATPVSLLTPVQFDPATDRRTEVKEECKLGQMFETHVGESLPRYTKSTGTTTSTDGDVVRLTVTDIWGARGNSWTGPKGLFIRVELLHDGKVQRDTQLHRTSMGGFWGAFKGICGFMDRDAEALGKDVAKWVRDPHYTVQDDGHGEAAADAPASAASR